MTRKDEQREKKVLDNIREMGRIGEIDYYRLKDLVATWQEATCNCPMSGADSGTDGTCNCGGGGAQAKIEIEILDE